MFRSLLLTSFVLFCAERTSGSEAEQIWAAAGDTAILPCKITSRTDDTIEWTKDSDKVKGQYAFVYREGCETFDMKDEGFQFRTNLFLKEMKTGNISLRISNVRPSDEGTYQCRLIKGKPGKPVVIKTLQLFVFTVSEPKLSLVTLAGDEVTIQCEAQCWMPEPQIAFLDDEGNNVSPENPKRQQESSGCFTVKSTATLRAAERITCRVNQPQTNQTRDTKVEIPATNTSSCLVPWIILGVAFFGVLVFFFWKCFSWGINCPERKQPPDQSTTNTVPENHNPPNRTDSRDEVAAEHQRELDRLKSTLQDKEAIINQKNEELKQLRAQMSPVVCQHGHPLMVNNPSEGSDQDLTSSPSSIGRNTTTSPKKKALKQTAPGDLPRCQSECRPRPNIPNKILRRYSTSSKDSNRFSVRAESRDDVEPLMETPTDPQQ
ncbi:butyrophilin subfamily 1 member A1-like [Echeneis naucrates]|uniref:butyrophilin subfamily 1 member A1-like n=1 Tax=Echeneis naucrates TaxID=173247 RepID=UPI0011134D77|nr:butyrophilin subfamily 1 member A1-like [Echeneis naucrates]